MDVARRTTLAPLANSLEGERKINEIMARGVFTMPSGRNLLVIRARAETPELAFAMANGLVETFRERAAQDRVDQAALAIAFYENRLQEAEQRVSHRIGRSSGPSPAFRTWSTSIRLTRSSSRYPLTAAIRSAP